MRWKEKKTQIKFNRKKICNNNNNDDDTGTMTTDRSNINIFTEKKRMTHEIVTRRLGERVGELCWTGLL